MNEFELEKVTRDDLRKINPGKAVVYQLPTAKACESARATASQLKALEQLDLSTRINYLNCEITIFRHK